MEIFFFLTLLTKLLIARNTYFNINKFFTNFGFFILELKFKISSITKTCPSQCFEDQFQ